MRHQLISLLSELFQITASTIAVFMPQLQWRLITDATNSWERIGATLWPKFGGFVLVEAVEKNFIEPKTARGVSVLDTVPIETVAKYDRRKILLENLVNLTA